MTHTPRFIGLIVLTFNLTLFAVHGPLRVHPQNGRYFADTSGQAILLTGSHTWATVQDIAFEGQSTFNYDDFLDMCASNGHNFIRLWFWEQPMGAGWSRTPVYFSPLPWARAKRGKAADGKAKFDLDTFNPDYFVRLRERVEGMDPYCFHPFNPTNNIHGIGAAHSTEDSDSSETIHSLKNPAVVAQQEAYVRQVIDTVNDLDNVLYEIINEGGTITIDLRYAHGPFAVEWFHPLERRAVTFAEPLMGGDYRILAAPFAGEAVLYLERR